MNYITMINTFWQEHDAGKFSQSEIAVYFYILNVFNKTRWKDEVRYSDRNLSGQIGISVNTLRTARQALKERGVIDFITNGGGLRGYEGLTIYKITVSKNDTQPDTHIDTQPDTQPEITVSKNDTYIKQEKNINNTKQHSKIAPELNISFEEFWKHYDKAAGLKSKLEKKWRALTNDERVKAMKHITEYKIAEPDKKFRKNPETYLNNKSFNDEIIYKNKNGIQQQQQPTTRIYTAQEIAQREKLLAAGRKSIAP